MTKRALVLGVAAVVLIVGAVALWRGPFSGKGAVAQGPRQGGGGVPVVTAVAAKKNVPVQIELLGTVTPIASVAIKSRLETEITAVHFRDGAMVKQGDLLFTLDARAIEAQIREIDGLLASARAQLEQNQRDLERYTELVAKNAATQVTLNNTRTQVNVWSAAVSANSAKLDNLKVQLSYATIRAPISGRASMAAVKIGNFVRPADTAPLATIIQTAPIYVTFALPQTSLPTLRAALGAETATVRAIVPGEERHADGQVSMIENLVDVSTGTVPVRATMPNAGEILWPGTLVRVRLTFREEEAVTVPPTAVQVSQTGAYVYVVANGVAKVQPVKVARTLQNETVLEGGLEGGETVVTDGHLRLTNGSRVAPRRANVGS
ncbi:MAG: efflux RND transporter periplasmic adaptor subunit [Alphaproteobacteria bacterium]|nr:efflux RND transporter periplasmic adaptor subunit [Alphaproteobacteria bacterium]